MEKDINIKTFQFSQGLMKLINQSGLPVANITIVMENITAQVKQAFQQQLSQSYKEIELEGARREKNQDKNN